MSKIVEALRELIGAHDGFSAKQDVGRMPAAWVSARAALAEHDAQPAQARPPTDAQIRRIQAEHPTENDPLPFARAIERAHGIKGVE